MIDQMLTKDEKKLFSKRNIRRIRRTDFVEYIKMYEAQLDSLKNGYSPEVYKNPIVEEIIAELEQFIQDLNNYYYDNVVTRPENYTMEMMDEVDEAFSNSFESEMKPLTKAITKEQKKLNR